MNMRHKFIIILFLTVFHNLVLAKMLIEKKPCPSIEDLTKCSNQCEDYEGILQVEFLIKDDKVLIKHYVDAELIDSRFLKNCSVIDNKNWICEHDGSIVDVQDKMINGVFNRLVYETKQNVSLELSSCAK